MDNFNGEARTMPVQRMKPRVRTCSTTTKIRYPDQLAARLALATLQREDDPEHQERKVYKCEWCGGWHLSSRAGQEF